MSTALSGLDSFRLAPEMEGFCLVHVLYEDTPARERAVWLSHHLVREFWAEIDFEFSWWRFKYLQDPEIASAAAAAALRGDIFIVSASAEAELPEEVVIWMQHWLVHRKNCPGVLVPLVHPATPEALSSSPVVAALRELAKRTGLECLLPTQLAGSSLLSEAGQKLQTRATQVTHVLDSILRSSHSPDPPVHWGLNE